MIYLVTFFISLLSTRIAEKSLRNKVSFYLFSAIAILVPAGLAGFRNTGIGTDTVTYAESVFNLFVNNKYSFIGFIKAYFNDELMGIEFNYLLINYLTALFTKDVHWFYFVADFIIILFFYLTAYDNRKVASMWLVMFLFFFLFYNASYNIMRQMLAVSLAIYAFKFIEKREWKKVLMWFFLIYFTHSSGVLYGIIAFTYVISALKNKRASFIIQFGFLVIILFFFIYFRTVLDLLTIFSSRFEKYNTLYSNEGKTVLVKNLILLYVFILFIYLLVRGIVSKEKRLKFSFYIYNRIVGIAFFLTSIISITASRMSWYVNVLDCIFFPRAIRLVALKNRKLANLLVFIMMVIIITIWYWNIILLKGHETYPYKSTILGI